MSAALHCIGLGKRYGDPPAATEVLRDIHLDVPAGQFVAVLGPSGCGKSTLLQLVAGLEAPSAGRTLLDGSEVRQPPAGVGVMFQDATLLPWLSALDNVLFPLAMQRRPTTQERDRARALLDQVGLTGAQARKPWQLSGGMRQRVALARALFGQPRLLLMDEPFSALDAIMREEMNELLLGIWEQQRPTVLLVTHSIAEALLLADRVIVLGGTPAQVVEDMAVSLPRPRAVTMADTPAFTALSARLRSRIRGHADAVA